MIYVGTKTRIALFWGMLLYIGIPPLQAQTTPSIGAYQEELIQPIGQRYAPEPSPRNPVDTLRNPFMPAFQLGSFRFAGADAGVNYSAGSNYSQFGFGGGIVSSPFPDRSQFEFDAGFHHGSRTYSYSDSLQSYSSTTNTSLLDLDAIYFWNQCDWRFGPTAGFHSQSNNYTYSGTSYTYNNSASAFNFGGYGEWLPECHYFGSLNAGYETGDDPGLYGGFDVGYYFCPEFDFCGGYEYYGDDAEKNYSIRAEYLFSTTMPLTVSAGFDYTALATGSNSNSISVGLKYLWNVPTSTTLEDRAHTGLLTGYQFRY